LIHLRILNSFCRVRQLRFNSKASLPILEVGSLTSSGSNLVAFGVSDAVIGSRLFSSNGIMDWGHTRCVRYVRTGMRSKLPPPVLLGCCNQLKTTLLGPIQRLHARLGKSGIQTAVESASLITNATDVYNVVVNNTLGVRTLTNIQRYI